MQAGHADSHRALLAGVAGDQVCGPYSTEDSLNARAMTGRHQQKQPRQEEVRGFHQGHTDPSTTQTLSLHKMCKGPRMAYSVTLLLQNEEAGRLVAWRPSKPEKVFSRILRPRTEES